MEARNFLHRARSRRLLQEEQNQVPTCPMVYAIVSEQPLSRLNSASRPETPQDESLGVSKDASAGVETPGRDGGGANPAESAAGANLLSLSPSQCSPDQSARAASRSASNGLAGGDPGGSAGRLTAHQRAKSWDVSILGHPVLGAHPGATRVSLRRAPISSLSLAVECLMNTALVTLEGTWTVESHGLAESCEWIFVLPINPKVSVSSVEVVTADGRFFTTAIVSSEEAGTIPQQPQPGSLAGSGGSGRWNRGGGGLLGGFGVPRFGSWGSGSLRDPHAEKPSVPSSSSLSLSRSRTSGSARGLEMGVCLGRDSLESPRPESSGGGGGCSDTARADANQGAGPAPVASVGRREGGGSGPLMPKAEWGAGGAPGAGFRGAGARSPLLLQDKEEYNPQFFRVRMPKIKDGSQVKVRVTYVEVMALKQGFFEVMVPLTLPPDVLPSPDSTTALHEVVRISCALNSGHAKPLKIGDFNHPMKVLFVELGRASFTGYAPPPANQQPPPQEQPDQEPPPPWPNTDFVVSYQVVCDDASAAMLVQAPYEDDPDTRAISCLSIVPPDSAKQPVFPRAIVFILDSVSAMKGKAMEEARRAVVGALKRLTPHESFAIIAFDYELLVFSERMERATPDAVKRAAKFYLQAYDTDNARNILAPLQLALKMLKGVRGVLPQIVLVSDSSVPDERIICRYLQDALLEWGPNAPRIFTCAIGPGCSYHFLRWISGVSRGFTEVASHADEVRKKLERLLHAVSRPLVSNITLKDMPSGLELHPVPIPDLYAGCPVVVSGKLAGDVPLHMEVRGVRANGAPWKARVALLDAANLPLSAVGVKDQVDLVTGQAWLEGAPAIQAQVTRLSISACIPCVHTRMVLFETNRELYDELQQDRIQGVDLKVQQYMDPKNGSVFVVAGLSQPLPGGRGTRACIAPRGGSDTLDSALSAQAKGQEGGARRHVSASRSQTSGDEKGSPSSQPCGSATSPRRTPSEGNSGMGMSESRSNSSSNPRKNRLFNSVLACYRLQQTP